MGILYSPCAAISALPIFPIPRGRPDIISACSYRYMEQHMRRTEENQKNNFAVYENMGPGEILEYTQQYSICIPQN